VAESGIKVTEKVTPKDSAQPSSREITFATAGLSRHIDAVAKACESADVPGQGIGERKS
jgi:hypothetical protein